MKKLVLTISIVAATIILFTGCKPKPENQFTNADVAKIAAWNKIFSNNKHAITDQPVPKDLADACIEKYCTIYKDPANNAAYIKSALTYSVDFGSVNLGNWMTDISTNTNAIQIKVCFGIYTSAYVAIYPTAKPDRLTVFLYPEDAKGNIAVYTSPSTYTPPIPSAQSGGQTGDPSNPLNLGGLEP